LSAALLLAISRLGSLGALIAGTARLRKRASLPEFPLPGARALQPFAARNCQLLARAARVAPAFDSG